MVGRIGGSAREQTLTPVLFATALFISAALMFIAEPMFAKMVLPLLGGAPSVWNTCLVFYQIVLLAGYAYSHWSLKWLGARRQAALHLAMLCLPWLVLPLHVAESWVPPHQAFPVPWLWMLLSVSVGLPMLAISATAPTLQAWFTQTRGRSAADPYYLYAASNLGSLIALLSYPLVIEPVLTLSQQSWCWAGGYVLLMALVGACAAKLWLPLGKGDLDLGPERLELPQTSTEAKPGARQRLRWLALSLVPSALLLGVTTHVSTDIAPMPLWWVVPLSLYLVTFVLSFSRRPLLPSEWVARAQPYFVVVAAAALAFGTQLAWTTLFFALLHLTAFFVTAMVCHSRLYADRPTEKHLTEFYLWVSLGGVLGGLFSALVAPMVFTGVIEYPLMIAVACALRPAAETGREGTRRWISIAAAVLAVAGVLAWALRTPWLLGDWAYAGSPPVKLAVVGTALAGAFLLRRWPLQFALGVAALSLISMNSGVKKTELLHAERSFFGVVRVEHNPSGDFNQLMHGSTCHGEQSRDEKERAEPWAYFHRKGPLGRIFQSLEGRRPLREIGVLGLGTGAIAAYGRPGERITFYEIDPGMERIANNRDYFTYLADCRERKVDVEIVPGDARLSLVRGPNRQYDLLVVDVFNSDSVPTHLLTREALKIYLGRAGDKGGCLAEKGVLAIHISNRYLDLAPVVGRLAEGEAVEARICVDHDVTGVFGKSGSTWVVLARKAEDLGSLALSPEWANLQGGGSRLWTDDFSNIVGAVRWGFSWESLWPFRSGGPSDSESHAMLAFMRFQEGQNEEAVAEYQKALQEDPGNAAYRNNLGLALFRSGRVDEAIEQYREVIKSSPEFPDAHTNLADALSRKGVFAEAIEEFRAAVKALEAGKAEPQETCRAYSNMANAMLRHGDVAGAIGAYRKALTLKSGSAECHNNLANALLQGGQINDAVAHYRMAVELDPNFAEAYSNLGNTLAQLGRPDEAVALYHRALKVNPKYARAYVNLGSTMGRVGRVDDAIGYFRQALQIEPDNADALGNLGKALLSKGRFDDAAAQFRKALEGNPSNVRAWVDLGTTLTVAGRLEEAVGPFRQALKLTPNDPSIHRSLGIVLLRSKKPAEAVAQWREGIRLCPNDVGLLSTLAWILATSPDASVRDGKAAVEAASQAARLTARQKCRVLDTLAAAYAEAGQFREAVDTAREALALPDLKQATEPGLADQFRARLRLYEAGKPYREGAAESSDPAPPRKANR
jgi:tetratricopeptide (TPR) repeat protein